MLREEGIMQGRAERQPEIDRINREIESLKMTLKQALHALTEGDQYDKSHCIASIKYILTK